MRKWQEIAFITLSNLCVAVIAGGILKIMFDKDNKIAAAIIIVLGVYLCIGTIILAKNIDEKKGLAMIDDSVYAVFGLAVVVTICWFLLAKYSKEPKTQN